MKPLYQLVNQHKALEQLDAEEIDEATLLATLEGLEGEIALKVESVAAYVRNVECFAEAVEDAAAKMKLRAERLNARANRVRAYLEQQMEKMGETKIETPQFVMQIKKNPPSVIIDDVDKIPAKYRYLPRVIEQVDKMSLRDALISGEVVPGAHLHHGKRLTIKE